jgi:hypothetical protein
VGSPVHTVPDTEPDRAPGWPKRRYFFLALLLIVAAIVIPPFINIGRFRPRIAGALSRSLGRTVIIGDVELQLLPAPGLKMARVVVDDDPAFSHEPLLRADGVTAWLRIASLWRGRLEIARLTFDSPSVNLVRRPDGHWNLESLLERARQAPVAPTAKRSAGPRTRFPYIEFNSGRINLKLGIEKTVFSLADADFALWLERENEWNVRLSAQPIRTDANLGDTGTVKLSGTIRRGSSLSDTPLDLHFGLERGQLGQLTTLIYGRDRGWRGSLDIAATLKGTPRALAINTSASVDDFTRYDIAGSSELLRTNCAAAFSSQTQVLKNVRCISPVGDGSIEVRGLLTGILPIQNYQFAVTARDVPAAAVAALVRHMKKDLPPDVSASGAVTAQFLVNRGTGPEAEWSGTGAVSALSLRSARMDGPLALGDVRFGVTAPKPPDHRRKLPAVPAGSFIVEPFAVNLGGRTPAHVQGVFSRTGYRIAVSGDTGLKRLLQISEALGVAAPRFSPDGDASVDLSIAGPWAGFAQPLVLGTAKVKAVVPVNGIGTPVQVASAAIDLAPDGIFVQHLEFGWPKAGVMLTGSIKLPRRCTTIETCPVDFKLHADTLDVAALNALLNPDKQKRSWYAFIETSAARNPILARLAASGTLSVGKLQARNVALNSLSADASLSGGILLLKNVEASAFKGKLTGTLRADFSDSKPQFESSGKLEKAALNSYPALARANWATGTLTTDFVIGAAGLTSDTLAASATGTFHYDWRGGTLATGLDGRGTPLRIADFRGTTELHNQQLSFSDGRMTTASRIYAVSGTVTFDRRFGLTLSRGDTPAYQITGTFDKPQIAPAAAAQAQLAP